MTEVLANEIRAGQILASEAHSGQVMVLITGRRVELREGNSGAVDGPVAGIIEREERSANVGSSEIGAGERGVGKRSIGQVGIAQICICKRGETDIGGAAVSMA